MSEPTVEIKDPQINSREIMARVQDRLQQRRAQVEAQGLDYEKLVDTDHGARIDKYLSTETSNGLDQVRSSAEGIFVSLVTRERRLPLFGSVLFIFENLLHKLVIKYVNRMAGRQIVFNRAASQVLGDLVQQQTENQARLEALERGMAELERRLAEIETIKRE